MAGQTSNKQNTDLPQHIGDLAKQFLGVQDSNPAPLDYKFDALTIALPTSQPAGT